MSKTESGREEQDGEWERGERELGSEEQDREWERGARESEEKHRVWELLLERSKGRDSCKSLINN